MIHCLMLSKNAGIRLHTQTLIYFTPFLISIFQSIGHISDAIINPAITIGAIIIGKKSLPVAMVYFVAQMIGSILGYGLLKVIYKGRFSGVNVFTTCIIQYLYIPHAENIKYDLIKKYLVIRLLHQKFFCTAVFRL